MNLVNGRVLNWKPSRPNAFKPKITLRATLTLPHEVDLRPHCAPIKDQGQMGSCSGFSSAACVEFLELAELRKHMPADQDPQEYIHGVFNKVSPMFIYNNERIKDGTLEHDAGATSLGDACEVLTQYGVCKEGTFPYLASNLKVRPPDAAYAEAKAHRVPKSYGIDLDANSLCGCLYEGFPFLFGITVWQSFMTESVAQTGVVPMPAFGESIDGGHALACIGYKYGEYWIFQNSWGPKWGVQGFGFLPWNYLLNYGMTGDLNTLRYA